MFNNIMFRVSSIISTICDGGKAIINYPKSIIISNTSKFRTNDKSKVKINKRK